MEKQYLDLSGAGKFLSKLKEIFSAKSHKHTKSDISDLPSTIGTLTGIKMNGASKGTSGVVDLGTVLTGGKQSTTSTVDGGSNIYTFSDGSTITIKNGSKGDPGTNATTTDVATTSANGLMSKDMVTKLNSITSGANIIEIWKDTEPTGQPVGSYWIKEY